MKLFRKPNSRFYWYDFTVRGRRYRGSTQETKSVRAVKAASLKLASVIEGTDSNGKSFTDNRPLTECPPFRSIPSYQNLVMGKSPSL